MTQTVISFAARPYQRKVIDFFRAGGRSAFEVWHRKAGKDRVAAHIESELAFGRVGLYWHALPKYEDARKVIWDAITPTGERLIDLCFPAAVCARRLDHDMKIELINGSIWQPVGADNFDSLVGASPVHVTYSEFALMHPNARQYIRPAIAQNNGTELFITTPRGYNHAHDLFDYAKTRTEWHTSLLTVEDTGVLPAGVLAEERATMPDELFRQEYYCDFSAANVGSILGRYIEQAEKAGRVSDEIEYEKGGAEIEISSDIGYTDSAAWWFWQPRYDGFALVDYEEDSGLDAAEWIARLKKKSKNIGKIWLPHDAKNKSFTWRHTVLEQFSRAFGWQRVGLVPRATKSDRINAARTLAPLCYFHKQRCAAGLKALRSWSFAYDEERHTFSREPLHDESSNGGDAFSYGAQVMQERRRPQVKTPKLGPKPFTMDWLAPLDKPQQSTYRME